VTVLGLPAGALAVRALHRLSRRWVVFVPAGFVLHDHLSIAEPALFARTALVGLRLAPAGTTATDLTAGALGPALEAELARPVTITPARRDGVRGPVEVVEILFAPSRPGAVLAEARRRRIPVG
jgi:hypothetical protein